MNSRLATAILLLASAAGALCGCKKTDEAGKEAAKAATAKGRQLVSPEEKAKAVKELEKVWREVAASVPAAAAPKDVKFHRDLAALTRFPHRLCGLGKVRVKIISADGKVKSVQELDELVTREQVLKTIPLSRARLDAIVQTAELARALGLTGFSERLEEITRATKVQGDTVEINILDAPGSLAASRYVENVLKHIGVDELYIQKFPVVQPVATECKLFVNGKEITGSDIYGPNSARAVIYQMRPNILEACVTPEEGLSGETLYVKDGSLANYPVLPKDKIVVMDFDCMNNWLDAFAMGARAVIFIGPADGKPAARAYHHVNVPAVLPRFYVPAEAAAKLKLTTRRQVTVKSACKWTQLAGRSVIAVIRGTDPKMIEGDPNQEDAQNRLAQALVLAAPLDSLSEVPYLSPGARDAANCAALLELARHLKANRPKRDVILCFLDGQAQNNLGARAFYGNISRSKPGVKARSLDEVDRMHSEELELRGYVMNIIERLERRFAKIDERTSLKGDEEAKKALDKEIAKLSLFSNETREQPRYKDVLDVLRAETRTQSGIAIEVLPPLRLELRRLKDELEAAEKKQSTPAGQLQDLKERIDALSKTVDKFVIKDLAWNSVERILYEDIDIDDQKQLEAMHRNEKDKGRHDALMKQTPEKFRQLIQYARQACQERIRELNDARARTEQSRILRDAVGPENNNILLHISFNLGDRRKRWGFIHGDDSMVALGDDQLVNYKTFFNVLEELADGSLKEKATGLYRKSIDLTYPNRLLAPAKFADSAFTARIFGLYNLSLMTVMDPMARQGQPVDTAEALDKANVLAQVRQVAAILKAFADDRDLTEVVPKIKASTQYIETEWSASKSKGARVTRLGGASAVPDHGPAEGRGTQAPSRSTRRDSSIQ